MNDKDLRPIVQRVILTELARIGECFVPVNSSNRHVHLCQEDVERLFGAGYHLTKMRDLVQPGQFACNERVTLETEKGKLTLRVVGPARKETQIELSLTDAVKVGMTPPIRMSGELEGSPGCSLTNGERAIHIPRGVIVAARHLHLAPDEAAAFGVKNGDIVELAVEGIRPVTLGNVIVRSGPEHLMEAHIDKDEANACGLTDGQLCRVLIKGRERRVPVSACAPQAAPAPQPPKAAEYAPPSRPAPRNTMLDVSKESRCLLTESDVLAAAGNGMKIIRYAEDAIITPLARDVAYEKGIELVAAVSPVG